MEYIETSISNLLNYITYVISLLNKNINNSLEKENLLKSFTVSEKIINFFINELKVIDNKYFSQLEIILNEIYTTIRKIHFSFSDYIEGSYFSKEKNFKLFKECCSRNEIYIRSLYEDVQFLQVKVNNNEKADSKSNKDNIGNNNSTGNKISIFSSKKINLKTKFLLKISLQKHLIKSVENIFINLIQFKDEVYYTKTDDAFGYFYFFRTEDGAWFWSPPKKDDPEDVWIQSPEIKILKGHWVDKIIPEYIESFIIWLDLFRPNIPEFI